ncbi:MAG: hypothetical protein WBZ29_10080 [Methanocella sp.]
MEGRRRVTEEDIHVTEALIGDSFGRLKRSITEAPHEAVRPAADMIRQHPFLAAAGAAGAGVVAFQLFKMMAPGPASKGQEKKGSRSSGLMGQMLSLAAPYIVSMLQQQLSKTMSGERR